MLKMVGATFIMQKYNKKALQGVVLEVLVAYGSHHVKYRMPSSDALQSRRPQRTVGNK